MSTLTITSPGVQINEIDLSLIARPIGATDVFITGFAPQGPTEEFTNVTSISEFEQIFGTPTNAAERYLYYTAKQILNTSPANLVVSRIPYGENLGDGYANQYSALAYPMVNLYQPTYVASASASFGEPSSVLLTEDQYVNILNGNVTWGTTPYTLSSVFVPLATSANVNPLTTPQYPFYDGFNGLNKPVTSVDVFNNILSSVGLASACSIPSYTYTSVVCTVATGYWNYTSLGNTSIISGYAPSQTTTSYDANGNVIPNTVPVINYLINGNGSSNVGSSTLCPSYSGNGVTTSSTVTAWTTYGYYANYYPENGLYTDKVSWTQNDVGWTSKGTLSAVNWGCIDFKGTGSNGRFVTLAQNSNVFSYSNDGVNWSTSTLPVAGDWRAIASGAGKFVALGFNSNVSVWSTDGVNWKSNTLPSTQNFISVAYGGVGKNAKFVAVANGYYDSNNALQNSNTILTSVDGINWTNVSVPAGRYYAVNWVKDKFVILQNASSNSYLYSSDGVTWLSSTLPKTANWTDVAYNSNNAKFVAISTGAWTAYSSDGIVWTSNTLPTALQNKNWVSVVPYYAGPTGGVLPNGFFAISNLNQNFAMTSPDGISWTQISLNATKNWRAVAYGNGALVMTANSSSQVQVFASNDNTQTSVVDLPDNVWVNKPCNTYDTIGNAGMVVLNSQKTSIDDLYQGYYVALCDTSSINPNTPFTAIQSVKTVSTANSTVNQNLITIPSTRLAFKLTGNPTASYTSNSISEVVEQYPTGYDLSDQASFSDTLILVLFRLKTSNYGQDSVQLDFITSEGYAGSLYSKRTQNNPKGGNPVSFYLGDVVNNNSSKMNIVTNTNLSDFGTWTHSDGRPAKSIKVSKAANNLYPLGVHVSSNDKNSKAIGSLPLKLTRILNVIQNNDSINIDVVAEAGLSTIHAGVSARATKYLSEPTIFDDNFVYDIQNLAITDGSANIGSGTPWEWYQMINNQFVSFANDVRKDHVFIADPLRNIFIQGKQKLSEAKGFNFSSQIYWPLKNLFSTTSDSSYVVTYGNWIKNFDVYGGKDVWLPPSGYVAAAIASSAQQSYPWGAVAGFNRGIINNVLDLAVNPTQKQRDLLYKININPIAFFPNDGYVIYGQKTLYRKPSAFDRLNVRRLFLTLEKETQALLKYFVFEPNTFSTRKRLVGALTPIFDQAKITDGLYDYTIVCDERNNTPDIIDNNELKVSIYIQPVRTAEFILADFIATRTGVNFNELIG